MRRPHRLAATVFGLCLAAQEVPLATRSDADMILLQPYLDGTPLGDGLEAFPVPGGTLVPLGELCRLLGFGIQVDRSKGRAEGFFIAESRRFDLDLARGEVTSEGRRRPLARGTAERQARDIYVEARLLAEWFPLQVEVDPKGSALVLKARERLPIQEAWERDRRFGHEGMRRYGEAPEGPVGRPAPTPYAFADIPFVDLSASASRISGQPGTRSSGTVAMAGDLLWMSAYGYASRDPDGRWRNARGTLFREDPRGGILGPLHARRVALGDLPTTPTLELAGGLPQGRGLSLDNFPVAYRTRFATRTFRGELPEGWSVEFFQNGGLVGFQRSRPDGRYEFPEVPLRFGLNEFRLVFHGPQGQEREERLRLDIAQDQPPPGTFYYGIAAVRPTFDTALALGATAPVLDQTAYLATAEYGLGGSLALQAGASRIPFADGSHTYGVVGLQGLFPYLALQITGAQDRAEGRPPGRAAQVMLRTGLGYSSLTLRGAAFRDGFQPSSYGGTTFAGAGQLLTSSYGADLSASGRLGRMPLFFTLGLEREDYTDQSNAQRERAQLGVQVAQLNLALSLARFRNPQQPDAPLEASLLVSRFWSQVSFQGDVTYHRSEGRSQLKGWNAQGEYRTEGGLQIRAGLRSLGPGTGPPLALAGLAKTTGRFGFGLDLQKDRNNLAAFLRFQVSLGREPRTGRIVTDALTMTGQGAVSAEAFLDANGNGRRDPGEAVIEGTRFKVGETRPASQVDDPRVTFITQLPRGQEMDVSLDESSLPDAAQQATVKAFTIVPRPGKVARLDFPVSTFGEVAGTTRIRQAGVSRELPGLEIELCTAAGERVKVLRSAYDGYFEFRDLPHGDYLLRVTAEETARMKLRPFEPRRFRIDGQRNFLDGCDVIVEPAQEAPAPRPASVPASPPAPPPRPTPAPAPPPPKAAPIQPPAPPVKPPPALPPSPPMAPSAVGPGSWTVVLVAAYEEATLTAARRELGPRAAGVFTRDLPQSRGGRPLRLVCYGHFVTQAEAHRALQSLPAHFFRGGNRPYERRLAPPTDSGSPP